MSRVCVWSSYAVVRLFLLYNNFVELELLAETDFKCFLSRIKDGFALFSIEISSVDVGSICSSCVSKTFPFSVWKAKEKRLWRRFEESFWRVGNNSEMRMLNIA